MTAQLTLAQVAESLGSLWQKVKQNPQPPARVLTQLAQGRRELGWEIGYLAQASANATASPVVGVTVNNDADFLAIRAYLIQMGVAGSGGPIPPTVTLQIRDSATGDTFFRQPGAAAGFLVEPYQPGAPAGYASQGRFVTAGISWDAPHVVKRGSSVFFEISNPTGYVFTGDVYMIYEGYRLYSNETEPIPSVIKGMAEPFSWNGTIVVPNSLASGLQNLGVVAMNGLDQNRYVLKRCAIRASGTVAVVNGINLFPEDVLAAQVYDSYQQNKLWGRISSPPGYGQFMPCKALVCGGSGAPWPWPRFVQGTDTIYVALYGDPAAWVGGNPGTIEVQFNGVRIYG